MAKRQSLTDKEAADRLRSLVLAACDGVRDLSNDRAYRLVRKQFVGRVEYSDVLPSFVRSQRDLTLLWHYLRDLSYSRPERRARVSAEFEPFIERAEGRSKPPFRASKWTGRRTVKEQAQIVLSIGPVAFEAVEMLLDEQEAPLHNGGPVESGRMDAIDQLRELHCALGELLNLAKAGAPIDSQLRAVRATKDRVLRWSKETYELCVGPTRLMATSAIAGSAVWFLTNLITKDIDASATFTAGVMGAGALASTRRSPGTV